jgi:hypothetical protein
MKTGYYAALFGAIVLVLTGCCSANRGGSDDNYTYGTGAESGSPTMRPGMDPTDPRDPTYLSHPGQRWPAGP